MSNEQQGLIRKNNGITIYTFPQGSEQWELIRKGKATTSRFSEILTAKELKFSKSAINYAAEIVAERLGVESTDFMPTYWMQYGMEAEEYAVAEFEQTTGLKVQKVGFCELTDWCGCSPDGLIGDDAVLEVKCPKAETLIKYHNVGTLPDEYLMQVQGELWVTGRSTCHFYAWHPQLEPLHLIVERDERIHDALYIAMPQFILLAKEMLAKVQARPVPDGWQYPGETVDLDWSDL